MTGDDVRREQARRIGVLILYWAGFEDEVTGEPLGSVEDIERFIDAMTGSSIPEACGLIRDGTTPSADPEAL